MKHFWLILTCSAVLVGCAATMPIKQYLAEHPEAQLQPTDEDGDGISDTVIILDGKGGAVIDDATGKPAEVPGSREQLDQAKATDDNIAALLASIGAVTGLGGTWLGKLWGAVKPTARANDLQLKFTGLIKSVQAVREDPGLTTVVDAIDETLKTSQEAVAGLRPAIAEVKEAIKTEAASNPAKAA